MQSEVRCYLLSKVFDRDFEACYVIGKSGRRMSPIINLSGAAPKLSYFSHGVTILNL